MDQRRTLGLAGAVTGVALAAGSAAFAGFLSKRRRGGDGDAPLYARKRPGTENPIVGRTVTKPRLVSLPLVDQREVPDKLSNFDICQLAAPVDTVGLQGSLDPSLA